MDVATSTPWHSLHQFFAKVIECYGHLHSWVWQIVIAVAQQHHLIVMREIIVWYCEPRGPHNCINQPIFAVWEGTVVYPYVFRPKDRDPITVWFCSVTVVGWARPHISITCNIVEGIIYHCRFESWDFTSNITMTQSFLHYRIIKIDIIPIYYQIIIFERKKKKLKCKIHSLCLTKFTLVL